MKRLNALVMVAGMGIASLFSGCSAYNLATGSDSSDIGGPSYQAYMEGIKISKQTDINITKNKAYVTFNGSVSVYEVLKGKIRIVSRTNRGERAIIEVSEGKHIYTSHSACGMFMVTVDAKKGYIYSISDYEMGKQHVMQWCAGQGYFSLNEIDKFKGMYFINNHIINEAERTRIDELVAESNVQSRYDDFIADIDKKAPKLKLVITAEQGVKIPEEGFFRKYYSPEMLKELSKGPRR